MSFLPNPLQPLEIVDLSIFVDHRELPCSKCLACSMFTPCAYPGYCYSLPVCQTDEEQALVGRRLYLAGIWAPGTRPLIRQDQYLGYGLSEHIRTAAERGVDRHIEMIQADIRGHEKARRGTSRN